MSSTDEDDFAALEHHHHFSLAWALMSVLLAGAVACTSLALLAQG